MSYCRWGEGDVYVFHLAGTEEDIVCMWCLLLSDEEKVDFVAKSKSEMVEHLKVHEAAGQNTAEAIPLLQEEIAEETKRSQP